MFLADCALQNNKSVESCYISAEVLLAMTIYERVLSWITWSNKSSRKSVTRDM